MNTSHEFRPLARYRQELSEEECLSILKKELRGVLSVNGDHGYPYGMPLDHYYNEEDGCLYFHSGKNGHRLDALKADDKVSYCVLCEEGRKEGDWALVFKSVIVFGRMEIVEDQQLIADICRRLSYKFTDDEAYIEGEIARSLPATILLRLRIEHLSGKRVTES